MSDDNAQTDPQHRPAVGGPVEHTVRPWGWCAGDGTPAHPADRVAQWPAHNRARMVCPLYDQAALDAAVAAERERWAKLCEFWDATHPVRLAAEIRRGR